VLPMEDADMSMSLSIELSRMNEQREPGKDLTTTLVHYVPFFFLYLGTDFSCIATCTKSLYMKSHVL